MIWNDIENSNDTVPQPAQDHNSSRSNRPSPIAWVFDTNGNDTVPTPVYAQDYNSSRSNKPSPIAWVVDTSGNDTVPTPLFAQDYNSSRSNKPSPKAWVNGKPVYILDKNSNKSNRSKPIRIIEDIDDINNEEDEVVVVGKIIAINLKSRSFLLIDKQQQKISGQFQQKVSNEEIKELSRYFLNKQANIHVKINKTKMQSGKEIISYKL